MAKCISRRQGLKLGVASIALGTLPGSVSAHPREHAPRLSGKRSAAWKNRHDRVFLGGEYWANPMEDWRIADGMAECTSHGGNRSIHSLRHQIVDPAKPFRIATRFRKLTPEMAGGGAAIRIGIRSDIADHRADCFVQRGLDAGLLDDTLVLGENRLPISPSVDGSEYELVLEGRPTGSFMALSLTARNPTDGQSFGSIETIVAPDEVQGNVALVSNFTIPSVEHQGGAQGARYGFLDWEIEGQALCDLPEQSFGPILWAMYTLDDTGTSEGFVLKLSALTGPLGHADNHEVELQAFEQGQWNSVGLAKLDPDAWVATFRIARWDADHEFPYRLLYRESLRGGGEELHEFCGTIRANPVGRPLRMGALTCQNDYAFPYAPVADNIAALEPDLLLFSGDQIYENHGGYGLIRAPADRAILNYLRKYYQFGWAFREAMRHAPTVCLPDDHDVFQGNIWGEGGAAMSPEAIASGRADAWGGYIEPVRMINAVHRTHVAHLPDPHDPEPILRGITTYYTDLVYGGVSFAILADRMWKAGPERMGIRVGETGQWETPEEFNPALDRPGLPLLGDRQEAFLRQWAANWERHSLKAVLSQSVFAGISTHQPVPENYLKYDFDSNGWPSSARNAAVSLMRDARALHICGDTHLGTLSQYGVEGARDANWAFCTPAIAAGWPRWWLPDVVGLPFGERPAHGLANTGEYRDSFGNQIYVYAVGNPVVGTEENRYLRAHQKGSGFGFIEFDTEAATYTMHAYRFFADPVEAPADGQFPGWPVTVHRDENAGANRLG